jgi:hypothetical protein
MMPARASGRKAIARPAPKPALFSVVLRQPIGACVTFLVELGLRQTKLAEAVHIPVQRINVIVNQKRFTSLIPSIAPPLRFGRPTWIRG